MSKDVRVSVTRHKDVPGTPTSMLEVRIAVGEDYDRSVCVSDFKNKASKIQLCDSLVKMLEEVSKELKK